MGSNLGVTFGISVRGCCHYVGYAYGPVHAVDFQDQGFQNLRYLWVRVQIETVQPLMMGFYLKLDNGVTIWIQFRYERVFRICQKCGCIRHIARDCTKPKEHVQAAIDVHKDEIRRRYRCPGLVNHSYPLFVSEAAAFSDSKSRRTTRLSYSHFTMDGPVYSLHDHNLIRFRKTGQDSQLRRHRRMCFEFPMTLRRRTLLVIPNPWRCNLAHHRIARHMVRMMFRFRHQF